MTNGYTSICMKEAFVREHIDPYLSESGHCSRPQLVKYAIMKLQEGK